MISGTTHGNPVKLCTVIILLKAYQNTKKFKNPTYDVIMASLLKIMGKFGSPHAINHLKSNDSFPKMLFLLTFEGLNQNLWPFTM